MTGKEILDLPMDLNDAHAATVKEYLKALLVNLWDEEESFSGKRPFGNSGWTGELYRPLIKAGVCPGETGRRRLHRGVRSQGSRPPDRVRNRGVMRIPPP